MSKKLDLTGQTFERLTVIKEGPGHITKGGYKKANWFCKCSCGKELLVITDCLRRGSTKSCGCLNKDNTIKRNTTHNKTKTTLYKQWESIKKRCLDSNSKPYKNYGGRGISMYQDWIEDYQCFEAYINKHIGARPSKGYSIDRIDNNKNYEPGNIRWATNNQQAQNRRSTKLNPTLVKEIRSLYKKGLSQTELAIQFKVNVGTIWFIVNNKTWKDVY